MTGYMLSWGQVLQCLALAVGAAVIYLALMLLLARIMGGSTRFEKREREHYVGGWAERDTERKWN